MAEISFEVKQDAIALVRSTSIDANFDECEASLTEMIAPYKTLVVNEEDIPAAKADRAKLRKMASSIDEVRKTVKKAYTEPLNQFETRCKKLISIIDGGTDNIDGQIKAFEARTAEEKLSQLKACYTGLAGSEVLEYCPWESIVNPKWTNKGYAFETACDEIRAAISGVTQDIDTIRSIGGDDAAYLLDVYKSTHNLSAVIRKQAELNAMRQREEERKSRYEKMPPYDPPVAVEPKSEAPESADGEKLLSVTFRVECTKEQLVALGNYMKKNGIKYGRAN